MPFIISFLPWRITTWINVDINCAWSPPPPPYSYEIDPRCEWSFQGKWLEAIGDGSLPSNEPCVDGNVRPLLNVAVLDEQGPAKSVATMLKSTIWSILLNCRCSSKVIVKTCFCNNRVQLRYFNKIRWSICCISTWTFFVKQGTSFLCSPLQTCKQIEQNVTSVTTCNQNMYKMFSSVYNIVQWRQKGRISLSLSSSLALSPLFVHM